MSTTLLTLMIFLSMHFIYYTNQSSPLNRVSIVFVFKKVLIVFFDVSFIRPLKTFKLS